MVECEVFREQNVLLAANSVADVELQVNRLSGEQSFFRGNVLTIANYSV